MFNAPDRRVVTLLFAGVLVLVLASSTFAANAPIATYSISGQAQTSAREIPTESLSTTNLSTGLPFIENVGQFPDAVRFQAGNLWLTDDSLWLTVMEPITTAVTVAQPESLNLGMASDAYLRRGVNLKLSFVGANSQPSIEPFGLKQTYVNYFQGNDSAQWQSNVPTWTGVRYIDIYPGLNLEVSSTDGQWSWRFVSSGETRAASQSLIAVKLRVEGSNGLTLLNDKLQLTTTIGVVNLPLVMVDESLVDSHAQQVSVISAAIVNQPFTTTPIAPIYTAAESSSLRWATYLGGSYRDYAVALALTTNDEVVVAGGTESSDFPVTPGAFDTSTSYYLDDDGFVARLSSDGSTLRWATYLGGSSVDVDHAVALALTTNDEAVVAGKTWSSDFPVTPGAFDTSYNGSSDGFVARLSADGSALRWATYLGGRSGNEGYALALTTNDEAVVAGKTWSSDFPVTPGAFDTSYNGNDDGFVARLSADRVLSGYV